MIIEQARRMTDHLCRQQIIKEEEKESYYFCFEVVLMAAYFWLIALVLALVTGQMAECLVYLAAFTLMRSAAGGYHAASHRRCLALSTASLAAFLAIEMLVPERWMIGIILTASVYAIYSVWRYAPIDHPNNPFTADERKRNRRKSLIYLGILSGGLMLLLAARQTHLAFCLVLGLIQAAAALNIAIWTKQGGEANEKHLDQSTGFAG